MATTKFDVGEYEVAAEISGEGSPTVVFVSGAGAGKDSWDVAIAALRNSTTLLTYDRPGIGDSEAPASVRTVGAASEELHRLLVATGLEGPFVLVGHSIGGLIALIYAARWPVAGLVLVDTSDIHLNLDITEPILIAPDGRLSYDVSASVAEVAQSRRPLGVPTGVIASRVSRWPGVDVKPWHPFGLTDLDERWQHHQQSLAADLGATHKLARFGGHDIPNDDPTIVAQSIDDLIDSAR
ncbi:alpha/beta hydrolase [Kribbella sp. NPDC006257]|uniref:alpha/beta fold hydrolase n=1 Tax=Kribbella sp. NPDC006257 TaxID=3156738 RepID=UPI0033BDF720